MGFSACETYLLGNEYLYHDIIKYSDTQACTFTYDYRCCCRSANNDTINYIHFLYLIFDGCPGFLDWEERLYIIGLFDDCQTGLRVWKRSSVIGTSLVCGASSKSTFTGRRILCLDG